jgi:integrase/recombinase XerD
MILILLYASGIRVSELCELRWRDLQPSGASGQVTVLGKGSKTRSIPLPGSVWTRLLETRGEAEAGEPVFKSRKKGAALTPQGVSAVVRAAARRAGIEGNVSPHWLRHAHGSVTPVLRQPGAICTPAPRMVPAAFLRLSKHRQR